MRLSHYVAPLLLLMVITSCASQPAKLSKTQQTFPTSWLAGTWSTTQGDQIIRETWVAPTGNHMSGAVRRFSVQSGKLQDESVLVIRQVGQGLSLTLMGDRIPVETLQGRVRGPKEVIFEGSPTATITRMAYMRVGDRTLTVEQTQRIEGQDQPLKQRWVLVSSQP